MTETGRKSKIIPLETFLQETRRKEGDGRRRRGERGARRGDERRLKGRDEEEEEKNVRSRPEAQSMNNPEEG